MGSWSVYCGISKITITAGTKCVLVPIYENLHRSETMSIYHYCLPIFGEYSDYGDIENIEEDKFTKLLEELHKMKIQDFCNHLTNGFREKKPKFPKISYMWIHREVYDFMISYSPKQYERAGDLSMGKTELLAYIGFNFIGKDKSRKRYDQVWEYENKKYYSDGEWLEKEKGGNIYRIGDLQKLLPDKDLSSLENIEKQHTYFLYKDMRPRYELLNYVFGFPRYLEYGLDDMKDLISKIGDIKDVDFDLNELEVFKSNFEKKRKEKEKKEKDIYSVYIEQFMDDEFCKRAADLVTLHKNMYPGSYSLEPYKLYITPQCGEHRTHQVLLKKFADINGTYFNENDVDEDDQ